MNSTYKQNKTIQSKKNTQPSGQFWIEREERAKQKTRYATFGSTKNYFEKNKEHSHARRNTR